jgi:chitinase
MLSRKITSLLIYSLLTISAIAQAEQKESTDNNSEIIGYWQNFRNTATQPLRLSEIPEGYSIVIIAFGSVNPYGNVKFTLQGPPYKTMADGVTLFKSDIKSLQNKGVKVILSLGGMNSLLHLDNPKKANDFITSLEQIITDYGFDGVDYDFEGTLNKPTLSALLEVTRKISSDFSDKGSPLIFTAAPEAIDVNWQVSEGKYDQLIGSGLIDVASVQLYNSTCKRSYKTGSPCYKPGTQDFIVSQADSTIQTWLNRGIKDAESKYVIGLPASKHAANNGYVAPEIANKALTCLKKGIDCESYKPTKIYPNIGGLMMWSINWDAKNDYAFFDNIGE